MSMRFPGGLIATSPVNARYPSGVWTQAQTAPYQAQNVWTRDRFWPNTTLLLQGDGAVNGAQNNTFLDSSSNNFTITRNGNTTQGSFTPYEPEGYWSNFFDGSGDNLTTPSNAALAFGSSDFTIEAWVNPSSKVKAYPSIFGNTVGFGSNYVSLQFDHDSAARKFRFWVYNANSGSPLLESPAAYSYSNWYHVAVTRSGSTFRMFIDGTLVVSATYSGAVDGGSSQVARIGGNATSDDDFAGTVSNFRIVKGTALYTANFTPPAAPLTAITNTSLLTCQSNRFKDNSTNNFTLTVNGNTSVQAFQPFPGATTWSASVLGGSGYFDGSGDYLDISHNANLTPSGDFTIEFWAYPTTASGIREWYSKGSGIQVYSNGASWAFAASSNNSGTYFISASFGALVPNAWQHIAVTRSGNSYVGFVNGVATTLGTSASAPGTGTSVVRLGEYSDNPIYPVVGYMAAVRFVNGTAVYGTSNFTPPTAPPTAVSNTQLLVNFTNAGIYDNSMMNNLETVGNAQVSTSVVKYGTGSMAFDGSGDYLSAPNNQNFVFGTGDFTVEAWINVPSVAAASQAIVDTRSAGGSSAGFYFGLASATLQIFSSGSINLTGGNIVPNIWTHVAVTRAGNTVKLFVDGVQVNSTTNSTNWTDNRLLVGVAVGILTPITGYIDDLRITKAARYITNFTPPIARLPAQ